MTEPTVTISMELAREPSDACSAPPGNDAGTFWGSAMNREQWENLARFAGVDENTRNYGWYPRSDWNDFGPLWVKLRNWANSDEYVNSSDFTLDHSWHHFCAAKLSESDLMQAGCLLGAAIGATMGDKA